MKKFVPIAIVVFLMIFFGLLIYASLTSDSVNEIKTELTQLDAEEVNSVIIEPVNLDWNINLTLEPIVVTDNAHITQLVNVLNQIDSDYPGRPLNNGWEAFLKIELAEGKIRKFKVIESFEGVALLFTNTMGHPKYLMNELEPLLEELAENNEPLGNR